MSAEEARTVHWALGLSALGLCLYLLASALWPPTFGYDFGNLWLVWRSYLEGAPLGYYLLPDPADLGRDRLLPSVTWASLPVYAVGLLQALGLPTAIVINLVLLSSAMAVGYWCLYTRLDFAPPIRALSIAALLLGFHHVYPFRNFWSGDPYLAAAFPWLLWLALELERAPRPWHLLALGLGSWLAYGAKLSGLLFGALIALGFTLSMVRRARRERRWQRLAWCAAALLAAGLGTLLAQLMFVGGFVNAATTRCGQMAEPWVLIGKALAFPWLSSFGGEALLNRSLPDWEEGGLLVVVAVIGAALLAHGSWSYARAGHWVAVSVLLGSTLVLATLFLLGSCVEPLERQFRFAGSLLLPLLLQALWRHRRQGPLLAWSACAFVMLVGSLSWVHATRFNWRAGANPWGLATPCTPPEVGARLLELESEPGPRWVAFVPSHDWLAFLPRARVMLDTMTPTAERLFDPCPRAVRFRTGSSERILVVVPPEAFDCGLEAFTRSFDVEGSRSWRLEHYGGWTLLLWRHER